MTKKILLDSQSTQNFYGARSTLLTFSGVVSGVAPNSHADFSLALASTGLINGFECDAEGVVLRVYENEAARTLDANRLHNAQLTSPINGLIFDEVLQKDVKLNKLISFRSDIGSGLLYCRLLNQSSGDSIGSVTLIVDVTSFFEVKPLRNQISSGVITYPLSNKIYDLQVCDTLMSISTIHTKTKLGSCQLQILETPLNSTTAIIKYAASYANVTLNKFEVPNNILFAKDSLVSLKIINASIIEELFFNIVFERL